MSAVSGSKRSRSGSRSRPRTPQNEGTSNINHTSPITYKVSGSVPHSNRNYKADALQKCLHRETKNFIVGPMPVDDFLNTFLPKSGSGPESTKLSPTYFENVHKDALVVSGRGKKKTIHLQESRMYPAFIACMEGLDLMSLEFTNSSRRGGDEDWVNDHLKPDVSVYRKGSATNRTRFSEMELFIEFKPQSLDDPFEGSSTTPEESFVKTTSTAQHIIGQMVSYVVAQLGSGFRTHTFSVLVVGDIARLIRWDRAGAIVSEPIEYAKDPTSFADFFRRYDQLTPEQRGHDTTVSTPMAEELAKARKALIPEEKEENESDKSFQSRRNAILGQTFYKFAVQKHDSSEPSYFVGPKSTHMAQSLVGRASRGNPVCELKTGNVCYLKDTWRIDSSRLSKEGSIYEKLRKHEVPNTAPLVDEGDVRNVKAAEALRNTRTGSPYLRERTSLPADHTPIDGVATTSGDASPYTDDTTTAQALSESSPQDFSATAADDGDSDSVGTQDTSIINPPSSAILEPGHSVPDSQDGDTRDGFAANHHGVADTDASLLSSHAGSSRPNVQSQDKVETTHETVTQLFADESWVYRPKGGRRRLHGYIHYRLVLGIVGRDLLSFRSTKELLTAVMDAMEAHGKAYEDAGILHRDISPGNIMITKDGRGFLIDWDLSKEVDEEKAVRHGRTGTWQFISAALLQDKRGKKHTYADDLESFLHVLTYVCVRYTASTYTGDDLGNYLAMFDEDVVFNKPDGTSYTTGGGQKAFTLSKRKYIPDELTFRDRPKLHALLKRFSYMFHVLYADNEPTSDDPVETEVSVETAAEADLRRIAEQEKKARKMDVLHRWSRGGKIASKILKDALDDEDAWPKDDKSQLMSILTPYGRPSEPTEAVLKKRTEDSDRKRSRQLTSYASSYLSGATSTTSTANESFGSGKLPSMHELNESDDGYDDGGPPKKRSR
ncbi:hypothetical protein M0805_003005, partial [Coniferiporia weirii]